MSELRPGQRVKVTIEGPVSSVDGLGRFAVLGTEYYAFDVPIRASGVASEQGLKVEVEVLPDPEPEWQPGDVARDANGNLFWRHWDNADWSCSLLFPGNNYSPDVNTPAHPLTLVLRDGKPVTP